MARVLPSDVVHLIDRYWLGENNRDGRMPQTLGPDQAARVAGVVRLSEAIAEELLPSDTAAYQAFLIGVTACKSAVASWESGTSYELRHYHGSPEPHPLIQIRDALLRCADSGSTEGTAALSFISDSALRDVLQQDLSDAARALGNGEWKAATVLAASVAEALLLWVLSQQAEADLVDHVTSIPIRRDARSNMSTHQQMEHAAFGWFISTTKALGLIEAADAELLNRVADFRNLIHPGKALRTGYDCSRSTAHVAYGGVLRLVDVLVKVGHS